MRYAWLLLAAGSWAAPMPSGKTHVNSIGMKLVRVEPGAFTMGTDGAGGDFEEKPAHRVRITRAFYMGAFEVTNAQYERFDPAHRKLRGKLGYSNRDDEAAVFASGDDAVRFTHWLARREGLPYRLPTEAEWEYAARAGTAAPYYTGETLPAAFHKNPKLSWYPDPARSRGEVPVDLATGKTPADPWGLHDMHGNVEEWCADWYSPHEPGEQADPVGRASGDFRVTRGGQPFHGPEVPALGEPLGRAA